MMNQRRRSALSPTSWVTVQTAFMQGFAFLLFAIQAPRLGPRPFGLISLVMIFAGFVEFVLGECASETLISIPQAELEHFDVMNTLCALISVAFGVGVFAVAEPIAAWFSEPELVPITRVMAVLPLLSVIAAPANAMSKREMQFRPLALRTIFSLIAGGIVGISLTLLNYGVWALVWQVITQKFLAAVVLWRAVPLRFRFGSSCRHARDFRAYALPLLVSRTMSWASGNVPRFILGTFLGVNDLGILSLASRLSDIAVQLFLVPRYAVARVALRQYAVNRAGLPEAIRQLVFGYALLSFPACLGGAAIMPTLFRTWLDARWTPGILPAQLLLLVCVPSVTIFTVGALLMALNQQRAAAWLETAQTVGAVLAVSISAPFGMIASAAGIAARPFALLPLPLLVSARKCGLSAAQILVPQLPLLMAATGMAGAVSFLQYCLKPYVSGVILLLILASSGFVIYSGLVAARFPQFAARCVKRASAWADGIF
jgi:O-antigen/teichoic acid export membrane protein